MNDSTDSPAVSMTAATSSVSSAAMRRVAVVGCGVSGMGAALRLRERFPEVQLDIFDKRESAGGVLSTRLVDGFEIERSADNFITTMPWGLELCKKLGLENDVVPTSSQYRQTFIVWRNRLHKLPDGFMMMAPTKWLPLATTTLLTPWGKLRAAMEYFVPARKDDGDESMESFAVRRLGREAYERLVEPLISGVYAADMSKLSLMATMPRFREMEQKYGCLIRAMRHNRKAAKAQATQSGPRYSMFVTVRGGLSRIAERFQARLPQGAFHGGTEVTELRKTPDGWTLSWNEGGQTHTADYDAVILAVESYATAELLAGSGLSQASELVELLRGIEHSGCSILTVAYRREQIKHKMDGMGAVVPAAEHSPILALSFSSGKYPHRAPEGFTLLRIFAGSVRTPEITSMTDDELKALLLEHTSRILKISGEPILTDMARWPNFMPQLQLGHLERVARINAILAEIPTLAVAGNAFTGVGIPQCIHSGELAADKISGFIPAGSG